MNKKIDRRFGLGLLFVFLVLMLSACGGKTPIKIGYTAGVTGKNAALGVDGRDGALLAIEMINAAGGIDGHPLELIVEDDMSTDEGALVADMALIDADVTAIIGHMTSGAMTNVWPKVKDLGMVFLSPTVSTPELEKQKDNFFRLIPVNSYPSSNLAIYAFKELKIRKVAIFYETSNLSFTETYSDGFSSVFQEYGGEIVAYYPFLSLDNPDFAPLLQEAKDANVDGLFIIASAVDTALLVQQAHLLELDVPILTSNWAFTEDLIQNGGRAVDGILTVVSHDENNQTPAYLSFKESFLARFGRKPTFAAGYGYEAVMVLSAALEKTGGLKEGLAEALLETKDFPGVHGNISLDAYGDVERTLYLLTIENGKMKTIRSMEINIEQ